MMIVIGLLFLTLFSTQGEPGEERAVSLAPGLKVSVSTPGLDCSLHLFRMDGTACWVGNCATRAEFTIPEKLLTNLPLVLSMSAIGVLPQSILIDTDSLHDGLKWEPQIQPVGVILVAAEGRDFRDLKIKWPTGSKSMSRTIGRPLTKFLGIDEPPNLEPGFYLTGYIKTLAGPNRPADGILPVELRAATLKRSLSYKLSMTPIGAPNYPVHVFPVPDEDGLNTFEFELAQSAVYQDQYPVFLGLWLKQSDEQDPMVVAVRDEDSPRYTFRAKAKTLTVLGPINKIWDLYGLSSGMFKGIQLQAIGGGLPGQKVQVLDDPENVYLRFPDAWGVKSIPGLLYSVQSTKESEIATSPRYFLEGGGAFLPPDEYQLLCSDSAGKKIVVGGESNSLLVEKN
jgi:hypothetical protein